MGYGLPAAIGAQLARPDALVIDIDGDASFNMVLSELSTANQFNIGVKTIVLNNEEQGMVRRTRTSPDHIDLRVTCAGTSSCTIVAMRALSLFFFPQFCYSSSKYLQYFNIRVLAYGHTSTVSIL
jgi:hypothetical protein